MSERRWTSKEIIKMLDMMIGIIEPYADSAIDGQIDDNLCTLIDVTNWLLDGAYWVAGHRHSEYASARTIGERAYAALLQWKNWIQGVEDELA